MLLRRAGKSTWAAVTAFVVLGAIVLIRLDGVPVPVPALSLVATVALVLALLEAGRNVVSMWRGPLIVNFSGDDAEICNPREAEAVRSAARLRGTLGGAGHVHSGRLLLPALGWLAATLVAASAIMNPELDSVPGWPAVVAAAGLGSAVLFPAKPFFYREAMGGRVILYPRVVRDDLLIPATLSGDAFRALEARGEPPAGDPKTPAPGGASRRERARI